ncbi:MAG: signal peptide peptidase SppA [Smithellaceae bacterium]|nr:signal peptide peptidase SppA [Smithellaceae bacterium]
MKRFSILAAFCAVLLVCACSVPRINILDTTEDPLKEFTLEGKGEDKILMIPVNGMISASPKTGLLGSKPGTVEKVVAQLNKARSDSQIKAIILKVNSPGGTVTASDMLYHEIVAYKEKTGNKVSVIMMDSAASGAYYISLPADLIMAHPTTLTGSVGVIFMRPKAVGLMGKIGLDVEISKSGKNKDMGSPFRESSREEKILMQNTVDQFAKRFTGLVWKHRKMDANQMNTVSTARVFTADEALRLNLIDKIGYVSDVVGDTKKLAGVTEDARVVVYRRRSVPDDNYYHTPVASTESVHLSAIHIALPDILQCGAGFYYLWPGAIKFE